MATLKNRFFRYVTAALLVLTFFRLFFAGTARPTLVFAASIVPGATWTALNTGRHIQAHGGAVYHVDDTFYWIGEDKSDGTFFQNINCYSSKDLVSWRFEGLLLSKQGGGELGPRRILERPKVLFNKQSGKWVMYAHVDDEKYQEAKAGVATSNTICGMYEFDRSFRPLGFESRDMGLWQDEETGTGYLLTEDRQNGLRIDSLSKDYMSVESSIYTWSEKIESPAMIKHKGVHYMFGSHLTGWKTNDNVYSTATSISGPWSEWKTFATLGSHTFHSQTSYILRVGDAFIYMGDRWDPDNLMRSSYVWLPLEVGKDIVMHDHRSWSLDYLHGDWHETSSSIGYEAEEMKLLGTAKEMPCATCSSGSMVTGIEGTTSGVSFTHRSVGPRARATMMIYYLNQGTSQTFADVRVNGGPLQRTAFLPSEAANNETATVHITLAKGQNKIEVLGTGNQGPQLDKFEILYH